MAILYNRENQVFTLHTKNTTYQMKVDGFGHLLHLYYGGRIGEEDMSYLIIPMDRGFSGNPHEAGADKTYSLDTLPQEYPSQGSGDYRLGGLLLVNTDGSRAAKWEYQSHQITAGKYSIPGMPALYGTSECPGETLTIKLADKVTGVVVTLSYGVMDELDIITRSVAVTNGGNGTISLEQVHSACLDLLDGEWDVMHFHGRHNMERLMERVPVMYGEISIGSTRGTSSHQHNPFMILADKNTGEDSGACYGMSFIYSGGFKASVEMDANQQVRMVMGIQPETFSYQLSAGESFYAPEVVMTYSGQGLTKLSQNYHHVYRHHLCRGKYKLTRRPILINNWEATYHDFDSDKLVEIAREAAALGIEMLVMDDGWFGKRDSDTTGLGDWFVNENKLGGSLKSLAERVNQEGLKFGIWLEPEMISEDSDLYRAHSDWALAVPGRKPIRSRHQLVLDLTRADVREYLYEKIANILSQANVEYVKWDMNRSIADMYSHVLASGRQGEVAHRFVLGLYDLLERLTSRFENILFEGCSGGGGRFDPAMLYYQPQIWCSDNTDAIDRLKIQYGTSFVYPISTIGSHVSACPNHQNGRITPMETRGVVAMAGTFGFELDLSKVTEAEKACIRKQVAEYKQCQEMIHNGDYYRLTSPFENRLYTAWQFVTRDQSESLVQLVITEIEGNSVVISVRLKGLDETKYYQINGGECLSGAALMKGGYRLAPKDHEYAAVQLHLKETQY